VFKPNVTVPGPNNQTQGYIRAQDVIVYEVVTNNLWERPVYFAITVSEQNMIGLNQHLRLDGLAYKIVPIKSSQVFDYTEPDILYNKLMNVFQYRGLNDPDVYFEETTRRMVGNYKNIFLRLAAELGSRPGLSTPVEVDGQTLEKQNRDLAVSVLNKANHILPNDRYEIDYRILSGMITLYADLDEMDIARALLPELQDKVNSYDLSRNPRPKFTLAQAYKDVQAYEQAEVLFEELYEQFKDPMIKNELENIRRKKIKSETADTLSDSLVKP
jgi:tetratricopeptide (TPR) repeat protein